MVKVEEIKDRGQRAGSPLGSSSYSSSSDSVASSSSSLSTASSPEFESISQRLAALVDIVPPTTRQSLTSKLGAAASVAKWLGNIGGNIIWVVTTSALLVGLPLALALEDEAKIVQQEKEMLAQQQGAQGVGLSTVVSASSAYMDCHRCSRLMDNSQASQANHPAQDLFPLVSSCASVGSSLLVAQLLYHFVISLSHFCFVIQAPLWIVLSSAMRSG
jgi:import receptor subunit TOM22